jgi:predicted NBD/HSP70 family sugar kinase
MAGAADGQGGDGRGTNQLAMRLANERLILGLIRRRPGIAKAEIARVTGLTPQATTIIVNRLEADGLLARLDPTRGKVGQPAIPYALAPDGAFAIGLVVGRRGCDVVLTDFVAGVRRHEHLAYAYPEPEAIVGFAAEHAGHFAAGLPGGAIEARRRLTGVGVAMPFQLWDWETALKSPPGALAVWRDTDLGAALERRLGLPVTVGNDATAACGAELLFGQAGRFTDFLYIYIGTFVGGGLVLEGRVVNGRTGNAAAIGSLPMRDGPGDRLGQLIDWASLQVLEDRLVAAGRDPAGALGDDWAAAEPQLTAWIDALAPKLALTAVAASALVEIEAVVIDGALPAPIRERIVAAVAAALEDVDRQGVTPFETVSGTLGGRAPVLGAVALTLTGYAREPAIETVDWHTSDALRTRE